MKIEKPDAYERNLIRVLLREGKTYPEIKAAIQEERLNCGYTELITSQQIKAIEKDDKKNDGGDGPAA